MCLNPTKRLTPRTQRLPQNPTQPTPQQTCPPGCFAGCFAGGSRSPYHKGYDSFAFSRTGGLD